MEEPKHIFFDLDGTLTKSKSFMSDDMCKAFVRLWEKKNVAIVSGGTVEQILKQVVNGALNKCYILGQSGNSTVKDDKPLIVNHLGFSELHSILLHLEDLFVAQDIQVIERDRIEFRGGQVSYSFVGHNAPEQLKADFDPGGGKRTEMLVRTPFDNEKLKVRVGGTTCLDYYQYGKKENIQKLCRLLAWDLNDCLYFGDQLYEGGNDFDVTEIMNCVQVSGPESTLEYIKEMI